MHSLPDHLKRKVGLHLIPDSARPVSGGCIHESQLFDTQEGQLVFIKRNDVTKADLFAAEAHALEALRTATMIRIPTPYWQGILDGHAWLAMEGITLANRSDTKAQRRLGKALAELHTQRSASGQFGFARDNFIGATPQPNRWTENWADFFVTQRLEHQFRLAAERSRRFSEERSLLSAIHSHLDAIEVVPVLLHGDLWGGNVSFDPEGKPVLFDPASYYGDREADLAFTRMFGGFGGGFYEAYREQFVSVEPVRETIYNLYHVLNHFVLFGGGYGSQAEMMIRQILAEI